jgi:hypothetical protein
LRLFQRKCEAFIKTTRLFENFSENGGFNKKSEVFSKITRLFEDMELRLFQRNRGLIKLFPNKWRFVH